MIAPAIPQRLAPYMAPRPVLPPLAGQWPALALSRVPVLVIEDEAMIAWMLESLLEDMGFEAIMLASDAKEAAAAAERRAPELVISDINLGFGADGVEAVGAIRRTCSPAVVFVSGYIDENARSRIFEQVAGARILSKPLSGTVLSAVILETLQLNRAR